MSSGTIPEVRLISCVGVEADLPLLPHFLRHYLALGIAPTDMHLVLNARADDDPRLSEARSILAAHGVEPAEEWIEPYTSGAMWEKRREVQRRVAAPSDWVVSADVDEFCEFPEELRAFLAYCDRKGVTCVQGVFIDRLAMDGELKAVEAEPSIWEQFPIEADVICTVRSAESSMYWYGTVNIMACRGDVFPSRGGHQPLANGQLVSHILDRPLAEFPGITQPAFRFALPLRVHHFKWTDAVVERHRRRLDTPGASRAGSAYGRLLIDYFDRRDGRIALEDVPIRRHGLADRVPWRMRVAAFRAESHALRAGAFGLRVARAVKRRVV